MRYYCEFEKVLGTSKLTRFKLDFYEYIRETFVCLVVMEKPIYGKRDNALADILVFDTTMTESYIAENNSKVAQVKAH
ncbi:hypothetical protein ADH66_11765 [Acutalibacter muris]|uniref:Uncharacterized protein n=1 Tax=Acutalibacter muris TaxID=1796620 RepID=A0ABN5A3L5_9FIRM|nr:hypothetical protein A4V00_16550 [Hungateiclostridiaceae bacterium KB18]ASB41272.1 hypothetical protein ADH66_11765 [Acutalibacter muris]